jgi:hypothetical protein
MIGEDKDISEVEGKKETIVTKSENWLIFQAEYHTAYNPHYV